MSEKMEGMLALAAAAAAVAQSVLMTPRIALGFAIACLVILAAYKLVRT